MPKPTSRVVYAMCVEAGISRVLDWSSSWEALEVMERARGRVDAATQAGDAAQWFRTVAQLAAAQLRRVADAPADEYDEHLAEALRHV